MILPSTNDVTPTVALPWRSFLMAAAAALGQG
jgi:hypothetical protein